MYVAQRPWRPGRGALWRVAFNPTLDCPHHTGVQAVYPYTLR
eukprot:COSAG01_NODE_29029_length_647_cov_0.897810_1_plen_41_part_10